jgi:hypothetical protein
MYGARGTARRPRIILAEFIAGSVAMAFGVWLTAFSVDPGGRALGVWVIGAGLNYVPLAACTIALNQPAALEAELAGVDSILQLWIFVPLSLVILAVRSAVSRRA